VGAKPGCVSGGRCVASPSWLQQLALAVQLSWNFLVSLWTKGSLQRQRNRIRKKVSCSPPWTFSEQSELGLGKNCWPFTRWSIGASREEVLGALLGAGRADHQF